MRCAIGWHAWGHQYDRGLLEAREASPNAQALGFYPFWERVCRRCGHTDGRHNQPWPKLQVVIPLPKKA